MIRVILSYGSGDRKAAAISDGLIVNVATATMRARQELAKYTYIHMARGLSLPHDPHEAAAGVITDEFSYQKLGIYGRHLVKSRTINLTPTSAMDNIEIEQYREMIL